MAKFLTDADFAEIRQTINDTVETFAQKQVQYMLSPSQTLSRFGRDKHEATDKTEYNLLGLVVWNPTDAELKIEELGKYDFSMGYVLFGFDYLETEGLITNSTDGGGRPIKVPVFKPEKDFIYIEGEKLQIMGVQLAGQLKDVEAVVKVFFKRDLKNG